MHDLLHLCNRQETFSLVLEPVYLVNGHTHEVILVRGDQHTVNGDTGHPHQGRPAHLVSGDTHEVIPVGEDQHILSMVTHMRSSLLGETSTHCQNDIGHPYQGRPAHLVNGDTPEVILVR